jgi:hypothetical protein
MGEPVIIVTPEALRELVREAVREALSGAPAPEPAPTFVAPAAIAKHYGVSRGTVANWVKEGCPHEQRGRVLRFELAAVEAWFRGRPRGLRAVR